MSIVDQQTHAPPVASPRDRGARPWLAVAERMGLVLLPVLVIGLLVWPMLVRTDFGGDDWDTHAWFLWHQSESLRHDWHPSFFVHFDGGVFYPHFAFYGGTLSALAGALSLVLGGDGHRAYVATWILAFIAAYGGWYWLGRMAGLGRWVAQAPGIMSVTSAYYLTVVYARGDWPEFIAVSVMPLVAAATISVVRADRLRLGPGLALAGAMIIFTGSHNLTLLYGGLFLVALLVALLVCVPAARRQVTRPGVLRWLSIAAPATLVNAWYLVPGIAYQGSTLISTRNGQADFFLHLAAPLVAPVHLFSLSRASAVAPETRRFALELPVLAMSWVVLTGAVMLMRRRGSAPWRRTLLVLAVVTTAVTVVMMNVGIVLALPAKLQILQFTYRLESYVLIGIAGALLAALVLVRGSGRQMWLWTWVLVPVLAFAVVGGARQADHYPRGGHHATFQDPHLPAMGDFTDGNLPALDTTGLAEAVVPLGGIRHDRATITVAAEPGQFINSNLLTLPQMIRIQGARVVGVHPVPSRYQGEFVRAVLQIDDDARPGAAKITVSGVRSPPVVAGEVLSLFGIAGLGASLLVGLRRRRRA